MRKVLLVSLVAVAACSASPDRSEVVSVVTSDALLPAIDEAVIELAALDDVVAAFCADPSELNLASARDGWRRAKDAWESSEVTVFYGPAPMLRTESKVDFEPVSPEGIEELLASNAVIDSDYVDNRSAASRRGLGTIEYLIFAPLESAAEPRRCQLASASASVAAAAADAMQVAWVEQGLEGAETYQVVFTEIMEANSSLADVVGAQFEILNRQTLFELGKALGVTAPEADLAAIPEGPAGAGVDRYLAQLTGIQNSLRAGGDSSLIELIRSRSDEVAADLEAHLDSAVSGLEGIDGPMVAAVEEQPEMMTSILEDLTAARDLLHVDIVSLLDLTLGFSDSDGDSG